VGRATGFSFFRRSLDLFAKVVVSLLHDMMVLFPLCCMFCAREFRLVYSFVVMGYVALCVFVAAPSQLCR